MHVYSVVIADDDLVIRATLKDIVNWESLGFEIVGEAKNGKLALEFLDSHDVNVLITDMKMPIMDGLELIKQLENQDITIIALSSFDEFELVRDAFKLGVEDYLLKSHLDQGHLCELLTKIHKDLDAKCVRINKKGKKSVLDNFLKGNTDLYDDGHMFSIIQVDVSDEQKLQGRFKDIRQDLIWPMEELLLQISGVSKRCEHSEYTDSCLILRYHDEMLVEKNILRICRQIQTVLKNYMNLEVTVSASVVRKGAGCISEATEESMALLNLRYVFGEHRVYLKQEKLLDFGYLEYEKKYFQGLLNALRVRDNEALMQEQEKLFAVLRGMEKKEIEKQCIYMLYLEGIMLKNMGASMWSVFGKNVSFPEKLERLTNANDYTIWMYNFNRFLFDYLEKTSSNRGERSFEAVRRYIMDNYADAELNLTEAASIAGLNESYFSSKFKKEFGTSFSDYLKNIRVNHARKLMENSNLKIYEISQAVGYRNVEHFTRVFKSCVGVSPKKYMEQDVESRKKT